MNSLANRRRPFFRQCVGAIVAAFVSPFCLTLPLAAAPYHIGLVFLDQELDIPYMPQVKDQNGEFITDSVYRPFTLTAPANLSVSQGGLAGWTEADVRSALRFRVEQAYRAVVPPNPAHTLSVNFYNGFAPAAATGRRLNVVIGTNDLNTTQYGLSAIGSAFETTQFPNDYFIAAVFANNLDAIGQGFGVTLDTPDKVLNNLAGTIAHEIGHAFGLEHVAAGATGPFPLMATGNSGLTPAQKLTTRVFESASAELLVAALPNTNRADFNMDGDVDVFQIDGHGDAQVLASHLGAGPWASLLEGDVNSDGDVDVFQINGQGDAQLLGSRLGSVSTAMFASAASHSSFSLAAAYDGVPEPAALVLAGIALAALVAHRRRPPSAS